MDKVSKLYRTYKYNAKIRFIYFNLPFKLFEKLIKLPCYYCGAEPSPYNGIDRLYTRTSSKFLENTEEHDTSYSVNNAVPCCKRCNMSKHALSQESFAEFVVLCYPWAKNRLEEVKSKHYFDMRLLNRLLKGSTCYGGKSGIAKTMGVSVYMLNKKIAEYDKFLLEDLGVEVLG